VVKIEEGWGSLCLEEKKVYTEGEKAEENRGRVRAGGIYQSEELVLL